MLIIFKMDLIINKTKLYSPSSSKYNCNNCGKSYIRKSSLDKHYLLCEFSLISKREKQIFLEEKDELPSYEQLVGIMLNLSSKISKLEEKIGELSNYQKRKIKVIDWLNNNNLISLNLINNDFIKWYNEIQFEIKNFNIFIELNVINILDLIFDENNLNERNKFLPIECFQQKQNVFYVYINKNWILLDNSLFSKFVYKIKKKILDKLILFKEQNINLSDEVSIKYNNLLFKLMSIDQVFTKIKTNLFNRLKKDLKNLVEYEFEF